MLRTTRSVEVILVLVTLVLLCLLHQAAGSRMVVLNLFFLPIVLAAFFLGRYRAGILALFSVIGVALVATLNLHEFAIAASPLAIGLSLLVWAAVLGLTSILVGTLSDERTAKLVELHEAYVGVVEVLSRYLQSGNPVLKARSSRVAELCQQVGRQMRLSSREIDDIRVAALLRDLENLEITARVLKKAMGDLESDAGPVEQHTFQGTELVHSLGTVLTGAFPLILNQEDDAEIYSIDEEPVSLSDVPFGARIIRTVRAYDALLSGDMGTLGAAPQEVIRELHRDDAAGHDPAVLHALELVVMQNVPASGDAQRHSSATAPRERELAVAGRSSH